MKKKSMNRIIVILFAVSILTVASSCQKATEQKEQPIDRKEGTRISQEDQELFYRGIKAVREGDSEKYEEALEKLKASKEARMQEEEDPTFTAIKERLEKYNESMANKPEEENGEENVLLEERLKQMYEQNQKND